MGLPFRGMWAFARWSSTNALPQEVFPNAKNGFGYLRVPILIRTHINLSPLQTPTEKYEPHHRSSSCSI